MRIFTIGHSTRSIDEFIRVLKFHRIEVLADIRSFPVSRRLPHFNRDALQSRIAEEQIDYLWLKELGGRRNKIREDSPNVAMRSQSFRNYADHMLTEEFKKAAIDLAVMASSKRTAYMCAERVFFQCHRMLLSDWLRARGHRVEHIDGEGATTSHEMTTEARIVDGDVIYKGDRLF